MRSDLQIHSQRIMGIIADVYDTTLSSLSLLYHDPASLEINVAKAQVGYFLDPESTPEHQLEHGNIAFVFDDTKELFNLLIAQTSWQRFGNTKATIAFDRVCQINPFFVSQIIVEHPYDDQIQVDARRMHPFTVKIIYVGIYVFDRCLFKRHIQPDHILLNNVEIVFDRMRRVVATL